MVSVYAGIELLVVLPVRGGLHIPVQRRLSIFGMSGGRVGRSSGKAGIWDDERVGGCCSSPAC
jgi:hypothetical protein